MGLLFTVWVCGFINGRERCIFQGIMKGGGGDGGGRVEKARVRVMGMALRAVVWLGPGWWVVRGWWRCRNKVDD